MDKAKEQAEKLYGAGEAKLGTDEETFTIILAHEPFHQLRLIFDEYRKISGKTIEQAVKSEFSGDLQTAIETIGNGNSNIFYVIRFTVQLNLQFG